VAGAVYFALIFAAGFVLGTVRVLLIAPRLGPLVAVLLELPIILATAWVICDRISTWLVVPQRRRARLAMGGIAFTLLLLAELVLSISLLDSSVGEHFKAYATPHGGVGLAGQVLFAAFPLMQLTMSRSARTRT
jgi:hypothetical protein